MGTLKQGLTAAGALLLTGLIAIILVQAMSGKTATNNRVTAVQTETAAFFAASTPFTTALPDIRYIPVYTDSVVVGTKTRPYLSSYSSAQLTYYAAQRNISKVTEFYTIALSQNGWRRLFTKPTFSTYVWIDPSGLLPWHLLMDIRMEPTQVGGTDVTLNYERVPDVENNLPVYGDALEVEQKESTGFVDTFIGQQPTRIVTKTFLSNASLKEIEKYYNSILPEYGWEFFDENRSMKNGGPQTVDKQTGTLASQEGLFFKGHTFDSTKGKVYMVELFITASPDEGKQTKVELRANIHQVEFPGGI